MSENTTEIQCNHCGGRGFVVHRNMAVRIDCAMCNGTGKRKVTPTSGTTICAACEEETPTPIVIQIDMSGANCNISICPECQAEASKGGRSQPGLLIDVLRTAVVESIRRFVGII